MLFSSILYQRWRNLATFSFIVCCGLRIWTRKDIIQYLTHLALQDKAGSREERLSTLKAKTCKKSTGNAVKYSF